MSPTTMTAMVRLPISDYKERLLGKRLTATTPAFERGGIKIFHSETNPASLASDTSINSSQTLSPLQRLPAEIRLQILSSVFDDVKPLDWLSAHHHATPASVIFTCKQLYRECRQLALEASTFPYEDLPLNHRLVRFDSALIDQCQDGDR